MLARLRDLPSAAFHALVWALLVRAGLVTPNKRR